MTSSQSESLMFNSNSSPMKILGYEGSFQLNISLELRTIAMNGLLLYHHFLTGGHMLIQIKDGKIEASINNMTHAHSYKKVNDGQWHHIILSTHESQGFAALGVDSEMQTIEFTSKIRTGKINCYIIWLLRVQIWSPT